MADSKQQSFTGLWCNYAILLLATFSLYASILSVLGIVALVFGYVLRSRARKQEQPLQAAHASWQINTLWLNVLLFGLIIVTITLVAAWMGNNESVMAQLDAIAGGTATPLEKLQAFWNIPGSHLLVILPLCFALLMMIWPFQRILHGMLALRTGKSPLEPKSGGKLSLITALLIQIVLPFLVLALF